MINRRHFFVGVRSVNIDYFFRVFRRNTSIPNMTRAGKTITSYGFGWYFIARPINQFCNFFNTRLFFFYCFTRVIRHTDRAVGTRLFARTAFTGPEVTRGYLSACYNVLSPYYNVSNLKLRARNDCRIKTTAGRAKDGGKKNTETRAGH